jgi:CHAD domain-containing protein
MKANALPPEPEYPRVKPGDPAGTAIEALLTHAVQRLHLCDPAAREGVVEGVHRMRTSTRRLRSGLRTFGDLLAAEWAEPLESELKWLAGLLGAVRDLDVLELRLRSASEDLDALGPLFAALGERHGQASEALGRALKGRRYAALLDRLDRSAAQPALRGKADEPCREVLPPLVAQSWKKLKKRGRALQPDDPDPEFHELRKRAKRARYAAEAVADALDPDDSKDAWRFARLVTEVQDILGEHQDAVVATREIARIVAQHGRAGKFNLAAGRLLERQAVAANQSRDAFFEVWTRLDRKKVRRWFKG